MEGDDPYHDEGRVVGISLERECVRANIQNTLLIKKTKKHKNKIQLYLSNNAQQHPPSHPPTTPPTPPSKSLSN